MSLILSNGAKWITPTGQEAAKMSGDFSKPEMPFPEMPDMEGKSGFPGVPGMPGLFSEGGAGPKWGEETGWKGENEEKGEGGE